MAVERESGAECKRIQKLTKQEIDRRIDRLTSQLGAEGSDSLHPRWIAPAELVRQLRPFVVYN
jgi:hypothetical protein